MAWPMPIIHDLAYKAAVMSSLTGQNDRTCLVPRPEIPEPRYVGHVCRVMNTEMTRELTVFLFLVSILFLLGVIISVLDGN